MKIINTVEQSNGTLCFMDDESTWLRSPDRVWQKIRVSLEELQKEFDSIPDKSGKPWKV